MAATSEEPAKIKSSILQRLPRLSTAVWVLIIVCLFLIAGIPMAMGLWEQKSQQGKLNMEITRLQAEQAEYALLKAQPPAADKLKLAEARLRDAKSFLPNLADNSKILHDIMDLAWDPNVDVTIIRLEAAVTNDSAGAFKGFPSRVYTLSLTGQVDNFQKFIRAIGDKLPSSANANFTILPAVVEGELDQSTISILVYFSKYDE